MRAHPVGQAIASAALTRMHPGKSDPPLYPLRRVKVPAGKELQQHGHLDHRLPYLLIKVRFGAALEPLFHGWCGHF